MPSITIQLDSAREAHELYNNDPSNLKLIQERKEKDNKNNYHHFFQNNIQELNPMHMAKITIKNQ